MVRSDFAPSTGPSLAPGTSMRRLSCRVIAGSAAIACVSILSGCWESSRREPRHPDRHEERREERHEEHHEGHHEK